MRPRRRLAFLSWGVLSLGAAQAAETVDAEWIAGKLASAQPKTVEELLPLLPETYRSEFTLMYESHSRQDASPARPRAILYGGDARLLMAFNSGDPGQKGHDEIELIQFREREARFEFFMIQRGPGGALQLKPGEGCAECHGGPEDPRPNWQPYNHWPGAYSSDDDEVAGELTPPGERRNLKAFVDSAESHPRYSLLPRLREGYGPWAEHGNPRTSVLRNQTLTLRLSQLNFRRLARIVRSTPDYARWKYAILGSVLCGQDLGSFLPPAIRPAGRKFSPFAYLGYDDEERERAFGYVFESRGIPWRGWTMETAGVTSRMFEGNPFGSAGYSGPEFASRCVDQDPDLAGFGMISEVRYLDTPLRVILSPDCQKLQAKSLGALGR